MRTNKSLKEDIAFLDGIKGLCVAYEQISVMKMDKIRESVLYTRNFFNQLSQIYLQLKVNYKRQVLSLKRKNKIVDPSKSLLMGKNNKEVLVLITANNKLYGSILNKVFNLFIKEVSKSSGDAVIIGKLGKQLFEESGIKKTYQYFELPDEDLATEDLKGLISSLVNYSDINVYFGTYINFFKQQADKKNLSGSDEGQADDTVKKEFYYFEPDLEKILLFFETQIFASIFKQTASEGQLARYASRIGAMEQALISINKEEKIAHQQRIKEEKSWSESEQRERVSKIIFRNSLNQI
ncbi:hypothetical protein B6D29_00685 [Microgenomates bacterium UTCPR1]|nr:MAG: hypothetical protein B6D29_00685 [Microgenomates bacterium UTCPR1]